MAMVEDRPGGWPVPAVVPAAVAASLPAVVADAEAALRPATPREVAVVLGRLAAHYWHPDRPPEHHRLIWDDMLRDLADYPLAVLVEATDTWRRTESWAPKVCDLIRICDRLVSDRRGELVRQRFLAWCVETHGDRCPRPLRRIGDTLVDYRDVATPHILEAAIAGRTEFHGGLVLAAPGTVLAPPAPDPTITAYRERVRTILGDAGFGSLERLRLGDITEDRAEALAAERVAERAEEARRGRVLRMLLTAGIGIPEIEARGLLGLRDDEARTLIDERARGEVPE